MDWTWRGSGFNQAPRSLTFQREQSDASGQIVKIERPERVVVQFEHPQLRHPAERFFRYTWIN